MKIKKKYLRLVNFLNAFDAFKDSDTLVEINESKFNVLKEFAQAVNINIDNGETGESEPTGEQENNKIKLISEQDFIATDYTEAGATLKFGWYENGTTRLGIPACTSANPAIMFDDFYWKNNYTTNKVTKNGIECVSYEQWTTRGIGFNNLIIDSTVPVFFGMHSWDSGNWSNTIVYVNDELIESYRTLFNQEPPQAIRQLSTYNTYNPTKTNWWLTY